MSFLLRNNRKSNKSDGGLAPAMTTIIATPGLLSRPSIGVRSTGGGQSQTQVYRSNIQKPMQQPPQTRSQHIISMSEVMSDLRILEEQQNESRRRLEAAQATKQRRVDQQTELESKLDQLKYHNGQKRAELQNFHALLSEGQKSLQTARVSSEKAGGDLRDFDNLLKASLETKRAMFILQRNQDHLLDVLRDKVGVLERLSRKKEENFDRVKVEFDSVVKIEADLRESIHIASMKNHQIAESTASARTVTFKLEKSLDIAFKNESLLKLELENLSTEADADCKRHDQTEASNSSKVTELEKISDELAINATKLEQEIASSRELFLQCRGKLIELQRNEGHAINELPLDSNDSPVLDTERIRESFLAENESVKDELSATKEFKESISTLKIHLVQLKEQLNDAIKRSTQLSVSIGNAETVELARTEAFENLLHEIDSIRKEVDDKHAVLGEFRVKQNMEIDATKNKFTEISDEVITRREGLTNAKSERSKLNDEIENLQGTYRQLKIDDDRKIEAAHQGMENEMEKSEMLKDAADELEKTKEEPETMLFKKGKIEKIKLGILQILEENPILRDVLIVFDPSKTSSQQASSDLKHIADVCIKRIRSAKKMNMALNEREMMAREELEWSAEAEAEEEKRRTTTREKHRQRIESAMFKEAMPVTSTSERERGVNEDTSATKPRMLLESFTRASIEHEEISVSIRKIEAGPTEVIREKKVRWKDKNSIDKENFQSLRTDGDRAKTYSPREKRKIVVSLEAISNRNDTQIFKTIKSANDTDNRESSSNSNILIEENHGSRRSASSRSSSSRLSTTKRSTHLDKYKRGTNGTLSSRGDRMLEMDTNELPRKRLTPDKQSELLQKTMNDQGASGETKTKEETQVSSKKQSGTKNLTKSKGDAGSYSSSRRIDDGIKDSSETKLSFVRKGLDIQSSRSPSFTQKVRSRTKNSDALSSTLPHNSSERRATSAPMLKSFDNNKAGTNVKRRASLDTGVHDGEKRDSRQMKHHSIRLDDKKQQVKKRGAAEEKTKDSQNRSTMVGCLKRTNADSSKKNANVYEVGDKHVHMARNKILTEATSQKVLERDPKKALDDIQKKRTHVAVNEINHSSGESKDFKDRDRSRAKSRGSVNERGLSSEVYRESKKTKMESFGEDGAFSFL